MDMVKMWNILIFIIDVILSSKSVIVLFAI